MAKIFSDEIGKIIRLLANELQEKQYGVPPIYSFMLEFDSATNQEVINNLNSDWNNHTLLDDILRHNGAPVTINPPSEETLALRTIDTEYPLLPDWVRAGTASDAETYLTNQIFNGQSQAQAEAWIDANITNVTANTVAQINTRLEAIRQGLKLVAGAIITMRGFFVITAKLLIYIRDLVIRFRQS